MASHSQQPTNTVSMFQNPHPLSQPKLQNQQDTKTSVLTTKRLLLINGVNLNLLGKREPEIYGTTTLADIENRLQATANEQGVELICVQSNHEGKLVDAIQHHGLLVTTDEQVDGIIINPGAFTHTSVALRDALLATNKPFVEVHLSNVHAREPFRAVSYFSDKAVGVICGLGHLGYDMALQYFLSRSSH